MSAAEIREKASEWLARRMLGPWSETEEAALSAWRAQSLAHEIAYLRMEAGWSRTERLSVLRDPGKPAPRFSSKHRTIAFRIAAACIVATALAGVASFYTPPSNEQIYSTAVGGHKIITLTDGSRIELNTDTVLRVAQSDNGRKVWLDKGEAYFDIKHDAAHPFVVEIGKHRVTDLGTKFVIRETGERVDVSLLEGRARIDAPDAEDKTHSAILTPGDVAVATNNSLSVRKSPTRRIENDLAWRTGLLVFNNTTLGEAADAFNRYNRRKLVIENPQTAGLTIDGTFHTNNVMAFVDVAQHVLKLNVKTGNDEIVIAP
jgi:transmembrane sensor